VWDKNIRKMKDEFQPGKKNLLHAKFMKMKNQLKTFSPFERTRKIL